MPNNPTCKMGNLAFASELTYPDIVCSGQRGVKRFRWWVLPTVTQALACIGSMNRLLPGFTDRRPWGAVDPS